MAAESGKEVVFDSVEVLSRAKSQAESRIKLARSLLEDGEIKAADLRNIQILYEDARSDVNSGLDRLIVELETTGAYDTAEPYAQVAERAAQHVQEFMKTSDELVFGEDRSGLAGAGLSLAETFVTALVDVWKTLRGERTERHSLLIQRIGSLKWSEFDDI